MAYQAVIHELIGMKNNTVDLTGRLEAPDDLCQVTDVHQQLRVLPVQHVRKLWGDRTNDQNISPKFLEKSKISSEHREHQRHQRLHLRYSEFKKMSGTVSKHVVLVGELSREVKENALLDVSEFEQTIVCGYEKDNSIGKL